MSLKLLANMHSIFGANFIHDLGGLGKKKYKKSFPFYIQKTTVMCISSKFNVENSLQQRSCKQFLSIPGMIRLINMILF